MLTFAFQMSYTEHFSVDCPSTIAKLITTTHQNKEKNQELEKKKQKKKQANYQTLWKHCDQTMIGVKSASDWLS